MGAGTWILLPLDRATLTVPLCYLLILLSLFFLKASELQSYCPVEKIHIEKSNNSYCRDNN